MEWLLFITIIVLIVYIGIEKLDTSFFHTLDNHNFIENEECTKLTYFRYQKFLYLKSDIWKKKKQEVLSRDGFSCQVCGTSKHLHVHHTSGYDLIPNEPLDCLVTLCDDCHNLEHEKHGFPKTYDEYMTWNKPIHT